MYQYINPAKKRDMKVIKLLEKYLLLLKNKGKGYLDFGIIMAIDFINWPEIWKHKLGFELI